MKNMYGGKCLYCGHRVLAGQGNIVRSGSGYKVKHPKCTDKESLIVGERYEER